MISVIIPVYNTAAYLRKCVDSVLAQSYEELEVLLVDDGSTDESGTICDEYANKDTRVIVLHQENQGVSAARNHALKIAKGEWLSFVDSDDWLELDMYSRMLHIADQTSADIVICDLYEEIDRKREYRNIWKYIARKSELVFEDNEKYLYGFSYSPVLWNKLISRKLLGTNFFSEVCAYGEDTLFLADLVVRAGRIAVDTTPFYHYRADREGNVVSAGINPKMLDLLWAYDEVAAKMVAEGAYEAAAHFVYKVTLQVVAKIPPEVPKNTRIYLKEVQRIAKKYRKYMKGLNNNPRTSRFRREILRIIMYSPMAAVRLWNLSLHLKQ